MDKLFQHCTFDNPVFCGGLFWLVVFIISGISTLYYKVEEHKEAQAKQKAVDQVLLADKKAEKREEPQKVEYDEPSIVMETTESTKGNKPNNRRRKAAKRRAQLLEPTPDEVEETPDETPRQIELTGKEIADGWQVAK